MSCFFAYRKLRYPNMLRFAQGNERRAFPSRTLEFCTKAAQIFQHQSSGVRSSSLRISKQARKRRVALTLLCILQAILFISIERRAERGWPSGGNLKIMWPCMLKSMICKKLSSQAQPWRTINLITFAKNWRDLLNPLVWTSPTLPGHSREVN